MTEPTKSRAPEPREREAAPAPADHAESLRRESRLYTLLGILLVCCIVLMGNYLAFRHYARWDWTSERRYTLSERSREVLRELGTDIDVYLFLSDGEPNYGDVRELLDRYRAESSHVVVHFVDAVRQRTEYRALADRYGLGEAMFADGSMGADAAILITAGDRHWTITRDDLVAIDFGIDGSDQGPRVDMRAEQAISGGIVEVTMGRRTRICLTEGHGEWTLEGGSERNLSTFRDEMRRDNLEIEPFSTRGARSIPDTCDALFVIGPLQAFTPEEATLVRDYVRGGGNLFVAADAEIDRGEIRPTGLEGTLRDFGIRLDRALVLEMDPAHLHPGQPDPAGPFYVTSYGEHPVTRALQALPRPTAFWVARPVRPVDPERATVLLSASDQSFAETNIAALVESREPVRDEDDLPGPIPLAVATRVEPDGPARGDDGESDENARGGRVVVVGDAEFLQGDALQALQVANLELASAIAGWLTAREALIAIPPRRSQAEPVQLTQDDALNLGVRVAFLMPLAVVFLGFAVWWNRRT
ncbi:MAG: gliding motility-associated ABC transporter substrate-binding protein GldG [Sandaracinaceae bacterium]